MAPWLQSSNSTWQAVLISMAEAAMGTDDGCDLCHVIEASLDKLCRCSHNFRSTFKLHCHLHLLTCCGYEPRVRSASRDMVEVQSHVNLRLSPDFGLRCFLSPPCDVIASAAYCTAVHYLWRPKPKTARPLQLADTSARKVHARRHVY
jgi:hypothetical protein